MPVLRMSSTSHAKQGSDMDNTLTNLINNKQLKDDKCPRCGGQNSPKAGGNTKCFHCGDCGFVECNIFSPVDGGDLIENEVERYKKRLIAFRNSRRDKYLIERN